jgi:hypothetical protein
MIVEDNGIKMFDEEYEILNDKIINTLEDLYLKDFYKEIKKFQIIMVGYNASEQKDLGVFNKYDWNVRLLPIHDAKNKYSAYAFERHILPKMLYWFNVTRNDETNIFESGKISKGYITLVVNEKDTLYNLIKQLDATVHFYNYERFSCDNGSLAYYSVGREIDGYHLDISCKI